MKISIMQPTFIPWVGYFNLIYLSDIFIFLDDVQFDKRSWQQRNKILVKDEPKFLTVPVYSKKKFSQLINEVQINYENDWVKKHLQTLRHNYSKCEYFEEFYNLFSEVLQSREALLSNLNIKITKLICHYLSIKKKFIVSSSLDIKGKKTDRIINILKKCNATSYFSPEGSINYLEKDKFLNNNVNLKYIKYTPEKYFQKGATKFEAYLSILDYIFNNGKDLKLLFNNT